mgnify:CR=1 FL=1
MVKPNLKNLEYQDEFVGRHIGLSEADIADMLKFVGASSLDDLIDKAVPSEIRSDEHLIMPSKSESAVLSEIRKIATRNRVMKSFIGTGYYGSHLPSVILRNLLENPGWYTAYTPYQAEISQGRLEALINYQQLIVDLTGMELSNASLLDEGTAAAEAMTLMQRVTKSISDTIFVARDCHPQTIAIIKTRAQPLGIQVVVGDPFSNLKAREIFGAVLQYPTTDGRIEDYAGLVENLHMAGALVTVCADPLSLVLLKPPGEWGADVVVGTAQRFGVPMGFGGPHAGYMATRDAYKRSMPGRLIGVSIDSQGKKALRMALQTREQHIRREKATSNICTAQVLLANIAGMYAVYHGPTGLKTIAERVHLFTSILALGLERLNVEVKTKSYFDTLKIAVANAEVVHKRAADAGINLRAVDSNHIGISIDETTTRSDVELLWAIISGIKKFDFNVPKLARDAPQGIPLRLRRSSEILRHSVFNSYHSETAIMRYMRKLEHKDLALNQAMIPLGSCTMKLNAATEMIPATWPEFNNLHPFAPANQVEGSLMLIKELEEMLAKITGYDAVCLQPNAGSQGEYAGLLCIRQYHSSNGEGYRNICLIPSSAHGTNPASAIMAGMQVVVVNCNDTGNIHMTDLRAKVERYKNELAAIMITYPSTHGVFEENVREVCQLIHFHGGQVYIDGANLQAMVGICRPGDFGGDVSHLNLHKTFCIPHGGGGPGVGPIGVKKHLASFLPNHSEVKGAGPETGVGVISAAPWGSASILPISWAYIKLMGGDGLKRATQVAILSANYIAKRLEGHYDTLFTGKGGFVAHECILDTRPIQETSGITVDDIAKRMIDYGFHAPTMSWPVAGTLMVEPTESEPREEIDRICDAMIAIAAEAGLVASGELPADDNPLVNSPHTAAMVTNDFWSHPYSRETAAYPIPSLLQCKYWSPVGRVDNVYGDRNLICTCPPLSAYADAGE